MTKRTLTVAKPFPYAEDGLHTRTVQPGDKVTVDPALAQGLIDEGLCEDPGKSANGTDPANGADDATKAGAKQ